MRRISAVLFAVILSSAAAAWADSGATFYGDTTLGNTFNRPASLSALSTIGTNVRYSAQPFFPNSDANCLIHSVQEGDFDGYLLLYQGSFDPTSPLDNLIYLDDDGTLGIGSSEIPADPADLSVPLSFSSDYVLVTTGYGNSSFGTFTNHIECANPATRIIAGNGTLPTYDGRVAEVQNGRFQIYVSWRDFSSTTGFGTAVPMGSTDSALFWFFQPANWEMLVKVIDGCGLNNRFWVFAAATTNVEFTLTVVDTKPNPDVIYQVFNPLGSTAHVSITDTSAFATCP